MRHALQVLRIHLVPGPAALFWPWLILAISFLVNLAIFSLADVPAADRSTGGLASIYGVMLFATMAVCTQVFPFALGLGITRRSFVAGTSLFLVGHAVLAGVVLTALDGLEHATGGWGVEMRFFAPGFVDRDSVGAQFLLYAVPFLAVATLGMALGMVLKRWGASGMYVLSITAMVLGGAAAIVVGWRGWWGAVGRFFTQTDVLTLTAAYPAILAVAFVGLAWLGLRRATP